MTTAQSRPTKRPNEQPKLTSCESVLCFISIICFTTTIVRAANSAALDTNNNASRQQAVQATFSTPNQAINITHLTYDPLHDTVYLGATNAIYQLNGSDLSPQYEHITGPIFDYPSCGITECHDYADYMKPTTNVNKVLVIDYQNKKLLSCGSVKQGACRRYELNNISQKEDLIPVAVAANDDNSSTYAFIAPARYNYDTASSTNPSNGYQQQVLYVGTTYNKLGGQSRDLLVPAIGTRLLQQGPDLLKLYENVLDSARIDINSHLRDYFLVNYLYGFASSNYIYFVTVQKKATTRDYEELGYHTRLARICITDSSYNSYTEVDLKCMPNRRKSASKHRSFSDNQDGHSSLPNDYPLLQDAVLVDAGSHLLQSLAQNDQSSPLSSDYFFTGTGSASSDDSKVLLGVFSSAKDHTQHAGEHSALCAFSLSQIEEKFNDNIHNCYTGKMQSRNMEYIAGNVQECPKSGQGGNVVNFCHETLKINGTIPIVSEASLQLFNTTITAVTATSYVNTNQKNIYNELLSSQSYNSSRFTASSSAIPQSTPSPNTVVLLGTSNGHLKKVLLNNASNGIEFDDVHLDMDNNPIIGDMHLDASGQHVIAATPYKVMKVALQNCAQHTTCRECSQSRNPYCGWCSLKRSCTSKSECLSSSSSLIETRELTTIGRQQQPATGAIPPDSMAAKSQLKWISNESAGKCIDLQSIVPDKVPITSTGKIDLYIDRLQRSSSGSGSSSSNPKELLSYKCIFDRKEQTLATTTPFGLSCPLPKVMHRPKIQPGKDHVAVELSVRSSETNADFLNGKVTFFDCQLQTTCMNCLTASWGCNWCVNENVCLFNTSKCDKTGPASRLILDTATNTTTQTPLITISNAANQRSALSLTTISSSGGSGGISSTLVQSNQRASNTISQVNQCPGYDPSLLPVIKLDGGGSNGATNQADVSETNSGRRNTLQFTKVAQTTTARQVPINEPVLSQSVASFEVPSNGFDWTNLMATKRAQSSMGSTDAPTTGRGHPHQSYNQWPPYPPPSLTIPKIAPDNVFNDIMMIRQQQQQYSSRQQQPPQQESPSYTMPILALIFVTSLALVVVAAAAGRYSTSGFLLNKLNSLKSSRLVRRATGVAPASLASTSSVWGKSLPHHGNTMINSLRAGLKSSAASSVSGLSVICGQSHLVGKHQQACCYKSNYATTGQYYGQPHIMDSAPQYHYPPTADLLGTGYPYHNTNSNHHHHQQPQPSHQHPSQYPFHHIETTTANPAQTTRLIWQNGSRISPDGFTIDGSYVPLSNHAPKSDDTGSNTYQTIYS